MKKRRFEAIIAVSILSIMLSSVVRGDLLVDKEKFPDRDFRKQVLKNYGYSGDLSYYDYEGTISDERLDTTTFFEYYADSRYRNTIVTFEGFQYLKNLREIELAIFYPSYDYYYYYYYDIDIKRGINLTTSKYDMYLDLSENENLERVFIGNNFLFFYLPDKTIIEYPYERNKRSRYCEECSIDNINLTETITGAISERIVVLDSEKCFDLTDFINYGMELSRMRNIVGGELVGNKLKFMNRTVTYEYNCSKTSERWVKFEAQSFDLSLPNHPDCPPIEISLTNDMVDEEGNRVVWVTLKGVEPYLPYLVYHYGSLRPDHCLGDDDFVFLCVGEELTPQTKVRSYYNYGQIEQVGDDEYIFKFIIYKSTTNLEQNNKICVALALFNGGEYISEYAKPFSLAGNYVYSNILELPAVTSIANVAEDNETKRVEYFTLQGVRLSNPPAEPGIYIERKGDKTRKIVIK